MKLRIMLFAHFRNVVNSKEVEVETKGNTVNDAVRALIEAYPSLGPLILDGQKIKLYVNITLNGKSVKDERGLATVVKEEDKIAVFPPMAGG